MLNRGDGMILIMIFFLQNKKYTAVVLASVSTLFLPIVSSAQENVYVPLAAGLDKIYTTSTTFGQFLNSLFNIALTLGAVLAVLIIATAGLQYMTTDAVSGKTSGKEGIQRAVTGILMLLGIWLFFETINPDITDLDFGLTPAVIETGTGTLSEEAYAGVKTLIPGVIDGEEMHCVQSARELSCFPTKAECEYIFGSAYLESDCAPRSQGINFPDPTIRWYGIPPTTN